MTASVQIDCASIYDDVTLCNLLDLSPAVLARGRREEGLRFARKGQRILYLGQWVLDWLSMAPERAGTEK